MARTYKKKVGDRNYQHYNSAMLKKAVDAVRKKLLTISRASEKFGVPKSTICNHVKALSYNKKINNPGGQTMLSHDEEKNLVLGLIKCGEWGFPLKCRDIQLAVKSYLDRLGKKTRFKNNWPGKD